MERLSNLRQVLGKKLLDKVENSRILMVGSGGIGCELLKNLVMSGFKNIEIVRTLKNSINKILKYSNNNNDNN